MILAVTGTGTGVGKTHVACALLGALRARGVRAVGYKPVESGVDAGTITDEQRLREASVPAPPTLRLAAAVAPNVAARLAGVTIDPDAIRARLRELGDVIVVLELAGGLFSPLTDTLANASFLASLDPEPRVLVVAPDRLGVIHDVTATVRAASTVPLALHALVLVAPAVADASTGTNAGELARLGIPITSVPRATVDELARDPAIITLVAR